MADLSGVQRDIIIGLSDLINIKMKQLESEQKYPGTDPDAMNDKLTLLTKQVNYLLDTRTSFEIIMNDVILTSQRKSK